MFGHRAKPTRNHAEAGRLTRVCMLNEGSKREVGSGTAAVRAASAAAGATATTGATATGTARSGSSYGQGSRQVNVLTLVRMEKLLEEEGGVLE